MEKLPRPQGGCSRGSITLLPGRNGFQLQLSLVYSSGNGNGPFGLGWDLIPGLTRETFKGIPRYEDAKDFFVLSGVEELVPIKKETTPSAWKENFRNLRQELIGNSSPYV